MHGTIQRRTCAVAGLFALTGCATLPTIDYTYPATQAKLSVTLVQSADCNSDGTGVTTAAAAPTVTVSYRADYAKMMKANISATKGEWSDADFTLGFYDDGRLKSLNSSTTGQGEAIAKSVISLATAAAAVVGGAPPKSAAGKLAACTAITAWGKGKPVTVSYAKDLVLTEALGVVTLDADAASAPLWTALGGHATLGLFRISLSDLHAVKAFDDTTPEARHKRFASLEIQPVKVGLLEIQRNGAPIWSGQVIIPVDRDTPHVLRLPKAALFGKTTMAIQIAESGAVTSIQYANMSGAAGAINVLGAGATALAAQTDAEKAAATKAKADIIAQTQRLARCRAQPDKCE